MRISLPALVAVVMFSFLATAAACGSSARTEGGVTVEPATATATAATTQRTGGKPAAPAPTETPEPAPSEAQSEPTTAPADATAPASEPTSPPAPDPTATVSSPSTRTARWIDVDVTAFTVKLMDGDTVIRKIAPVGVGIQIDTGAYTSTQTGAFAVNSKVADLVYDAPYDTYISHWVGFDAEKDNGFHSFLKDASGAVVDPSTGRVSNGCIRTGDPQAIYDFAEIGMTVIVHA